MFFLSFDPLDCNFITYELGINLTSFNGFKEVKKVISKSYFINEIEMDLEKKHHEKF
jgi:hypothetical protein